VVLDIASMHLVQFTIFLGRNSVNSGCVEMNKGGVIHSLQVAWWLRAASPLGC